MKFVSATVAVSALAFSFFDPVFAAPPVDVAKLGANADPVTSLIIKFEPTKTTEISAAAAREDRVLRANSAASRFGVSLSYARTLASGAELVKLDRPMSTADALAVAAALSHTPGIRYAAPNRTIRTQLIPTDPMFTDSGQWGFKYVPGSIEGANFTAAWNTTTGSASQTIGIVDSGVARGQEDLATQLRIDPAFPYGGYDFVTEPSIAEDGDGRDSDPTDTAASCGHGTHVSGTIAAATSFVGGGVGGAGGASSSKILMARGLGPSIGSDADAIDAMLWLGGETVAGVAVNPNPVRMINMSFGGSGACGGAYQDAFDTLRGKGILPVVAAGNSSGDVSDSAPANCRGALAVAASDIAGSLAYFSNFGKGVAVTAPGLGILSTNGPTSGTCVKSGTSMAAPHVTAAAALLQAAQPALSVNQTQLAIRAGSRPFPFGSNCTAARCGAGLLDASNSLDAVIGPVVRLGWNEQAASLRESDGSATFTVSRIGSDSVAASATVVADDGTAVVGSDFSAPSPSTLVWAANDVSDRTVTVPIIYRPGEQGERAFSLRLSTSSPSVALVSPTSVSVRITEIDCATVTPIAMGQTLPGTLDSAAPVGTYCRGGVRGPEFNTVRYSFAANAGDVVSLEVRSTTVLPQVLDTYIYLLGPNREVLAENDDIVSTKIRDSRIEQFVLTTSGTHYIDVTTWSNSADATGSYNVHLYGCGPYVGGATCNLDVDGDGIADRGDAQLVLRRLLGFDGSSLSANSVFRGCATRKTGTDIANFVDPQRLLVGATIPLDIDGDGLVLAATDGLMLLRAALGLTGDAVVAAATAPGAPRTSWDDVRRYLNDSCGMALP